MSMSLKHILFVSSEIAIINNYELLFASINGQV